MQFEGIAMIMQLVVLKRKLQGYDSGMQVIEAQLIFIILLKKCEISSTVIMLLRQF